MFGANQVLILLQAQIIEHTYGQVREFLEWICRLKRLLTFSFSFLVLQSILKQRITSLNEAWRLEHQLAFICQSLVSLSFVVHWLGTLATMALKAIVGMLVAKVKLEKNLQFLYMFQARQFLDKNHMGTIGTRFDCIIFRALTPNKSFYHIKGILYPIRTNWHFNWIW